MDKAYKAKLFSIIYIMKVKIKTIKELLKLLKNDNEIFVEDFFGIYYKQINNKIYEFDKEDDGATYYIINKYLFIIKFLIKRNFYYFK